MTPTPRSRSGLGRIARRYGAQAAIIAIGAVFAVGTVGRTRFLPKPAITEKPFAAALTPKVVAAAKPWAILDAGNEHDRITQWIERLTSPGQRHGVEQTLAKKSKYEDMIRATSHPAARWHVIPADRNWYRDYLVAKAVVGALEGLRLKWPKSSEDLSKIRFK